MGRDIKTIPMKEKVEIAGYYEWALDVRGSVQESCIKTAMQFDVEENEVAGILSEVTQYKKDLYEADLITIGHTLVELFADEETRKLFDSLIHLERMARDFCEFGKAGISENQRIVHSVMKKLRIHFNAELMIKALQYLALCDISFRTKQVPIREKDAYCTLTVYHQYDGDTKGLPFYVQDFCSYAKTFCVLDGLESFYDDSGAELVKRIQEEFKMPIILQAGFLNYGEYELWRTGVEFNTVRDLVAYYEKLGFINVNSVIGGYEDSVIMLYCNGDEELKESIVAKMKPMNLF